MKMSTGLMYVGGIAAGLLLAKVCLGGTCLAGSFCGLTGCGGAALCQCCSRGSGVRECCPTICTACALPIVPPPPVS